MNADADLVDEDLIGSALTGGNGKRLDWNWSMGGRNAISVVKSVALDAVTGLSLGVVGGISLTSSTLSVDIEETRLANAGHGVDIQHLIATASGSADGSLSIIVIWGNTVGANSLH